MHRTTGENNVAGMFTDGPPGTCVEEGWLNAVQEELCYAITQSGQALADPTVDPATQLYEAMERSAASRQRPIHPNLLFNPTAERGNDWWHGGGAATDYDTPGVDTDQVIAHHSVAVFTPTQLTTIYGNLAYWYIVPAATWTGDLSEAIPLGAGVNLVLSYDYLLTAVIVNGNCGASIACYDSAGVFLGLICTATIDSSNMKTDAAKWTLAYNYGTTPLTTAYIRVLRYTDSTITASIFCIRAIKVENRAAEDSTAPTQYNDIQTQANKININMGNGSDYSFPVGVTRAYFNSYTQNEFWIHPQDTIANNIANISNSTAWRFSANRFMRLNITLAMNISGQSYISAGYGFLDIGPRWTCGSAASVFLQYRRLPLFYTSAISGASFEYGFEGVWTIVLDKNDTFYMNVANSEAQELWGRVTSFRIQEC